MPTQTDPVAKFVELYFCFEYGFLIRLSDNYLVHLFATKDRTGLWIFWKGGSAN